MQPNPSPAAFATRCAHLLATPKLAHAAAALSLSPAAAKTALREAIQSGFFRLVQHPAHASTILYQPTAKAAGLPAPTAPLVLRSNASRGAIFRALMRAEIVFSDPVAEWCSTIEAERWMASHDIPQRGHSAPLIRPARDGAWEIFEVLLPSESAESALMRIARRWVPLTDSGEKFTVHLSTPRAAAPAFQELLDEAMPGSAAHRRIAEIDAAISAGGDAIELAGQRVRAQRELAQAEVNTPGVPGFIAPHVLALTV